MPDTKKSALINYRQKY